MIKKKKRDVYKRQKWKSGSSMAVSLRYTDAEGSSQTEDLGTITLGNDTAGHVLESSREFELPADGIVEFHVKKNAALDVVLSWIAVQEVKKVSPCLLYTSILPLNEAKRPSQSRPSIRLRWTPCQTKPSMS